MVKIRSVSINDGMNEWLDKNPYISLSKICQEAIEKEILSNNSKVTTEENKSLRERIQSIMTTLNNMKDFINKHGLMDKYLMETNHT